MEDPESPPADVPFPRPHGALIAARGALVSARGALVSAREWASARPRLLVWIGLALCLLCTLRAEWGTGHFTPAGVRAELEKKEDIHNLYYAAAAAHWSDAPRWWVGSWIYPDVGYYRPLTSMLYLFEYRAFGTDFTLYNRVSLLFHLANVGLIYLLAVSLFRRHRLARPFVGAIAAYYFASTDNSMYFAVNRVLSWWPAQNDTMSLTFGLLCLLLLDQYLHTSRPGWLAGSLAALFLSIASKEMGFIVAPVALALVAQRRLTGPSPWRAATASVVVLTSFMWVFRRLVIPRVWEPVMFRRLIFMRMLTDWLGPGAYFAYAGIWWPLAASLLIGVIAAVGLKRRWPVVWILILCGVAACVTVQALVPDGTFFILLFGPDQARLSSAVLYLLAGILFIRYARIEPALFTGIALWLVYLPILQYGGGRHYYYWPGAFNALADGAFVVCLWRWALELKDGANWEVRIPFLTHALEAERENARIS